MNFAITRNDVSRNVGTVEGERRRPFVHTFGSAGHRRFRKDDGEIPGERDDLTTCYVKQRCRCTFVGSAGKRVRHGGREEANAREFRPLVCVTPGRSHCRLRLYLESDGTNRFNLMQAQMEAESLHVMYAVRNSGGGSRIFKLASCLYLNI